MYRHLLVLIAALAAVSLGFTGKMAQTREVPVVVVAQTAVPKAWQKDAVPRFSANGAFVEGIVYTSPWKKWTWNPKSGFTTGATITIEQANEVRYAPMPEALKAWNTRYGRSSSQGEKMGSHLMLATYPTGMSKNGSVVVGGYADDATGDKSGEAYGGTAEDGKDIFYYNRCFIWTRDSGFHDLWDLAGPKYPMQPAYIGGHYYCAVSPDGTKVVALAVTGKLTLFDLSKTQNKRAAPVFIAPAVRPAKTKSGRTGKTAVSVSAPAKTKKAARATSVLPFLFLNKSFADCEKILGKPKRVEVPSESSAAFTRYYPSLSKNVLRIALSSSTSETASLVIYQFARGRYPNGIAACRAIGIGAEAAENNEGLVAEGGALSVEWEKGTPQNDHPNHDTLTFTMPKKPRSPKIKPYEISLEGEVVEIRADKNTFTLRAHAVVNADNETVFFEPEREKIITAYATDLVGLQAGMQVRVVGRDKGAGKPLAARLVSVKR